MLLNTITLFSIVEIAFKNAPLKLLKGADMDHLTRSRKNLNDHFGLVLMTIDTETKEEAFLKPRQQGRRQENASSKASIYLMF